MIDKIKVWKILIDGNNVFKLLVWNKVFYLNVGN